MLSTAHLERVMRAGDRIADARRALEDVLDEERDTRTGYRAGSQRLDRVSSLRKARARLVDVERELRGLYS